jgi:D-tyrosyl-tRNA(Tyr) deacylase
VRAVVQRVSSASVTVDGETVGSIGPGLLVLLGIAPADGEEEARRMAAKVSSLRIFDDPDGRMSEPLGERRILCVSQFTLYGDVRKGTRPSFTAAAGPERAEPLYELVCDLLAAERGRFGAQMAVELVNDGPVTLLVEIDPPEAKYT